MAYNWKVSYISRKLPKTDEEKARFLIFPILSGSPPGHKGIFSAGRMASESTF
jgi:hypothetical protein